MYQMHTVTSFHASKSRSNSDRVSASRSQGEVHLDFRIEGDDLQSGGQVFDEQFLGFVQVNDPVIDPSST